MSAKRSPSGKRTIVCVCKDRVPPGGVMLCVCNGTSGSSESSSETWACDVRGYTYRKVIVHKHSTDFRQATRIITTRLPTSLEPGQAVVRVMYTGINASDINYTAGLYVLRALRGPSSTAG